VRMAKNSNILSERFSLACRRNGARRDRRREEEEGRKEKDGEEKKKGRERRKIVEYIWA